MTTASPIKDMLGRTSLKPVNTARALLLEAISPLKRDGISLSLDAALDRIVAANIIAEENLPPQARSVMDGFAVRASDTFGASATMPAYLQISGQVEMGKVPEGRIEQGKCYRIPTGGFLPQGADAVVILENTVPVNETTIEVVQGVGSGTHIIKSGEDIAKGEVFLQDIADVSLSDVNDEYVENMAVFLQSLDSDSSNNIVITQEMRDSLVNKNIDLRTASEGEVKELVESVGGTYVDEDKAMQHVQDMLEEYANMDKSEFEKRIEDDSQADKSGKSDNTVTNDSGDKSVDSQIDILQVDNEDIDLSTLIENAAIRLDGNGIVDTLDIDLNDIVELDEIPDLEELKIFGETGDKVTLEGGSDNWTSEGTTTIDGETFNVYQGTSGSSNIKVLIDEDVSIEPDF